MGCYSGNISLDFDGTNCEKQMMEKLLQLMELGSDEGKWTLSVNKEYDFYPATALLGLLRKRDDEKYCISSGVLEYTLAPKLFAALFPASKFRYSIVLYDSVTLEDTPYLTTIEAIYEGNKLMMRDSKLYGRGDEEKIAEICRKIIETDSEAREKYEQYREDADLDEDDYVSWFSLLGELIDDSHETMASLYDYRIVFPACNKKYEGSFFMRVTFRNTLCANK